MRNVPPVVKNLIILNVVLFIATYVVGYLTQNEDFLVHYLGLYYWKSDYFMPVQLITHMFMHGGLTHIFFNMFALWMFGSVLEQVWGAKRFFIYYIVTGLGAASLHLLVNHLQIMSMMGHINDFLANKPTAAGMSELIQRYWPEYYDQVYTKLIKEWNANPDSSYYLDQARIFLSELVKFKIDIPTVGASGAVFGLLLAFGMLFPNTQLMLLFPPIPIKAKYFVIGYGAIELYLGITQPGSNIAHFAHLGGMLFGFIMIRMWRTNRGNFY
jgi:membrane associated rhomboid family serine protease